MVIKASDAAHELLRRRKARSDLQSFIVYINQEYIVSDFSRTVCGELDLFIDNMMSGKRPILILGAPPQHGKLMADDTPVLTTKGWSTHGDLAVGDYVYGSQGRPVKVIAVSEKGRADMRVHLNNGDVFYCHERHEWTVHSRDKKREVTLETEQIAESSMTSGTLGKRGSRLKFSIPNRPPIDGNHTSLPLHPYALGVWLGDGTQTKPYISYEEKDSAVINSLKELGYDVAATYTHKDTGVLTSKINGLQEPLLEMGLMARKYGVRLKKVPEIYLNASLSQRLDLLAGLIDTDGYCYQKNGRVVFTTADELLADTFCELVSTFGWAYSRVTEKPKVSSSGIVGVSDYCVVGFNPTLEIPCRLERKVNVATKKQRRVGIRSITKDPQGKVGRCIQVSAEDGLYLVGKNMILTHNSDIVSRYLPAYFFGRFPDYRVAGLSYGKDLATDMNRDVQRIMMSEGYGKLFPGSALNSRRVVTLDVEAKRNSEVFEIVGHRGSYIGQGVGGPLTGKKVDLGIIDDPIKNAKEALSPTTKNAIWNWYVSTFLTRLSKNSGQIIMATRWALDDLSGRIEKKNPRARVLSFPAIDDFGNALIPELHPIDKLLETKDTMSEYFWSAMYQQNPIILGGGIFKEEWWQFYSMLPKIVYRVIYADTAQKTSEQNDYSVFQCWGMGHDGRIYLLDMIRGKWEAPELLINARAFWYKHKEALDRQLGTLRTLKVEDKSSGTGLIQQLSSGKNMIPVEGIPRDRDKVTRALDVAPQIKIGNVCLPETVPWLSDYLAEFSGFPNAPHDDIVDPTMDAISDMLINDNFIDYNSIL